MKDDRHYFVYLRPEFFESADKLKPLVAKHDKFIGCASIKHLPYYLEIKVPYSDPASNDIKVLELLIPHSQVLYVLNLAEKDLNKILGFCSRAD